MDPSVTGRAHVLDEGTRAQYKNGPAVRLMHLPRSLSTVPAVMATAGAASASAPAPWQVSASHLRRVMLLLNVSRREFDRSLSTFPVPHKHSPTQWGGPRKIGDSLLSRWVAGQVSMPAYRLAAAVALLELVSRQAEARWRTAQKRDRLTRRRLDLACAHHAVLAHDPALQPWLQIYRLAMRDRLTLDRDQSDADRALYDVYTRADP